MNARLPYSDSGRGWIVTGAMSTPTIAVETNSRPEGSSRNATGEEVTSQAARQTAGRASRAAGERLRHAAERGEPAGVLAQGLRHPLQVAGRALALELGRQHAGEHAEQLLVGVGEARRRARERGEAADPRAVRQLERDAEVGDGAELLLQVEPRVDGVGAQVVAAARPEVLGHAPAVGVAQRRRLVGLQAERLAGARVDDPVDVVAAVQVGEEERGVGQVRLEQVEHRARRVGERAVRGGRRDRRSLDGSHVHAPPIVAQDDELRRQAQTKVRSGAMRLATFLTPDGTERAGEVRGDTVVAFAGGSVRDRLASGETTPADGDEYALADVTLLAPVPRPRAIFGIGLNYAKHAAETGKEPPEQPMVFMKLPTSSVPGNGTVEVPAAAAHRLDYEAELVVVIGAGGAIGGYAVADDLSARDLQGRETQWTRAKGFDGCCPWGPWITTADEVADAQALRIGSTSTARSARTRHRRPDLRPAGAGRLPRRGDHARARRHRADRHARGRRSGDGPAALPRRRATSSGSRSRAWARSSTRSASAVSGANVNGGMVGGRVRAAAAPMSVSTVQTVG